jgi:hypothetical protein
MRLNPSLKVQKPNRPPPTSNQERPLGERRSAILKLLTIRTRLLVGIDKGEECRRPTLLEDNPASG